MKLSRNDLKGKSGVYKITNLVNGKIYIGSSKDLYDRWHAHLSELRRGIHNNRYLQASVDKYGINNFKFEIVEEVSEDLLLIKEQDWLDKTASYQRDLGYNILDKAGSSSGFKHSEKTKKKLSEIARNIELPKDHGRKTSLGKYKLSIEEISSLLSEVNSGGKRADLCKKYNISRHTLHRILKGNTYQYLVDKPTYVDGRQWRRQLTDQDIPVIIKMKSEGLSNTKIAEVFKVHRVTIGNILNGKTYKNI